MRKKKKTHNGSSSMTMPKHLQLLISPPIHKVMHVDEVFNEKMKHRKEMIHPGDSSRSVGTFLWEVCEIWSQISQEFT